MAGTLVRYHDVLLIKGLTDDGWTDMEGQYKVIGYSPTNGKIDLQYTDKNNSHTVPIYALYSEIMFLLDEGVLEIQSPSLED